MNQRKTSGKGVIGNFLSGLATSELPKLAPLAQAGVAGALGGRVPGIGGQILGGAAAPVVGSLVNTASGILGGLLSALPFKKGGIVARQPTMAEMQLRGLKFKKGGVVAPMMMKPKKKKMGKRKTKK